MVRDGVRWWEAVSAAAGLRKEGASLLLPVAGDGGAHEEERDDENDLPYSAGASMVAHSSSHTMRRWSTAGGCRGSSVRSVMVDEVQSAEGLHGLENVQARAVAMLRVVIPEASQSEEK